MHQDGIKKGRILVIDSDSTVCDMIADVLGGDGYAVAIGSSERHLVRFLENHNDVLVVICDYQLPDNDGLQIHRRFESVFLTRRIGFVIFYVEGLVDWGDPSVKRLVSCPWVRKMIKPIPDIFVPARVIEDLRRTLRPDG